MSTSLDSWAVTPIIDTADLVDSQEVADLLGLSHRSSVTTYLKRYDSFPRPVVDRGAGRTRMWLRSDVVGWKLRSTREGGS